MRNNQHLAPKNARATVILAAAGADYDQTLPLGEARPKLPRPNVEVDHPLAYPSQANFILSDNQSSTQGR